MLFSDKALLHYQNILCSNKLANFNVIKKPRFKYADNELEQIHDIKSNMNKYFQLQIYKANNYNNILSIDSDNKETIKKLNKKYNDVDIFDTNKKYDKMNEYFDEYSRYLKPKKIDSKFVTNIIIDELPIIEEIQRKVIIKKKNDKKKEENKQEFKNEEECKTKKRSLKYYYSKEDLIDFILKDENMKKKFPKNTIKKLSKDEICKIYFSKN
jgi:hypothetical protein